MKRIHSVKKGDLFTSLDFDSESKVLYLLNSGLVDEQVGMEIWRSAVKFTDSNSVQAVLVDTIQLKGTFSRLNDFFKNEAIPNLEKNGVLIISIAMATDVFSRFATNELLKLLNTKIKIKVFSKLTEAESFVNEKLGVVVKLN